jgi:glycosyltransferase involved in cell wall biosynthesis
MKICYINPTFLIRRPIAELLDILKDENDVALFLPKKVFGKVEQKWHSKIDFDKVKVYSYSAVNIPFIDFEWPIPITPMFFINLFRVFWNYNIIHMWAYFYLNSLFTVIYKLFAWKKKLIMTCDTFPGYSFSSGKIVDKLFFIYTILLGWLIFRVPNKIHIYGKGMIEFARKIGINEEKIIVLPTGINIEKFEKGRNIREDLGIEEDDFVLVYAGLIVPRKGIMTMIKIVKRLENKKIKLLLAGDGPKKEDYIRIVKELGLSDQIKFLGWRKDIPSVLKSSNILFLPSKGEGLPGIIMEAMATGLPVVASNIPCIPDLVENGVNGYLCGVDDVECFEETVKGLFEDKEKLIEIGKKGKDKIKDFKWSSLLKNYIKIYE